MLHRMRSEPIARVRTRRTEVLKDVEPAITQWLDHHLHALASLDYTLS